MNAVYKHVTHTHVGHEIMTSVLTSPRFQHANNTHYRGTPCKRYISIVYTGYRGNECYLRVGTVTMSVTTSSQAAQ